jgi:hypothetical protein
MASALRKRAVLITASGALLLTGCSSIDQPEVERVAMTFEDQSADPEARCDLLAPATLAKLEQEQSAPCTEAIGELPLEGGEVRAVEIWGSDAQVRLSGDTVFLTETDSGWRVAAAACTPHEDAPYDCEVEGP